MTDKERDEMEQRHKAFEDVVKPIIKYMAENYHPHTTLVINSTTAQIVEGVISTRTKEYLVD